MNETTLLTENQHEREYIKAIEHMKEKPLIERNRAFAFVAQAFPYVFAVVNGLTIAGYGVMTAYNDYMTDPSLVRGLSISVLLVLWILFAFAFTIWYHDEMSEIHRRIVLKKIQSWDVPKIIGAFIFSAYLTWSVTCDATLLFTDKTEIISIDYTSKRNALSTKYTRDTTTLNAEITKYVYDNKVRVRDGYSLRVGTEEPHKALVMQKIDITNDYRAALKKLEPKETSQIQKADKESKGTANKTSFGMVLLELASHIFGILFFVRQFALSEIAEKKLVQPEEVVQPEEKKEEHTVAFPTIGGDKEEDHNEKMAAILNAATREDTVKFITSLKNQYEAKGYLSDLQEIKMNNTYKQIFND